MFGRVSRYDEHPSKRDVYHDVIGRSTLPSELPLSSERSGSSPSRVLIPLLLIFFIITMSCHLLVPRMFLGWLIHGVCFALLGAVIYRLCPPEWVQRIEITSDTVYFERLGITGYMVEKIPLSQYRGIIPVTHIKVDEAGTPIKEFGAALRHADPTKTIILALTPLANDRLVDHYAQLLSVKPLYEKKFALQLRSGPKSLLQAEAKLT